MPGLDTLRSLAILLVIVFHIGAYGHGGKLADWLVPIARQGWIGVDLFFVLSGYLIGSQLLRPYLRGERPSIWGFYRNRFYRVLPAYLVVLAMYFTIPAWAEAPLSAPWQYLTFTFNLFVDYANHGGFSHVWSLCVEEHFYLLLPLIVIAAMRHPSARRTIAIILGLLLFGIFVRAYQLIHVLQPAAAQSGDFPYLYIERIYYPTYSRLDGLIAGVTLALVRTFRPAWWQMLARRGHTLLIAGLALAALAVWLFLDRFESVTGVAAAGTIIGFPLLALGIALIVASAISDNGLLSRVKVPGATLIATLAYSLYLTQKEMIHLVSAWFPWAEQRGGWQWCAIYAVCALGAAGILYLCVERPFLKLRAKARRVPARLVPETQEQQ